jgi:hypothetical protein
MIRPGDGGGSVLIVSSGEFDPWMFGLTAPARR